MLLTVTALILRVFSNPVANLFQKKLSNFESSLSLNFYSSLFMALLCAPFLNSMKFSAYNSEVYLLVLLAGVLCFLGTICLIKALSIGEMSVLGPVNSYKSVVGLIGAFLILGEIPSHLALLGFILIIAASFLFTDENGFFFNKSVLLRLLALIFTGIEAVILKKIILLTTPVECFVFWCLSGVLFSFIFALLNGKIKLNSKKSLKECFLIGLLLFIMQLSTNFVFERVNVGLSLSLFQLSSVVSLFLGFKIFHEKGILRKTIGTLIMISGSILILLN